MKNDKLYDFIETPLQLMDRTFHKYMNIELDSIGNAIINV